MGLGPMFFLNLLGGAGKRYSERKSEEREKQRRLDEMEQQHKYQLELFQEKLSAEKIQNQADKIEEEKKANTERVNTLNLRFGKEFNSAALAAQGAGATDLALKHGEQVFSAGYDPNVIFKTGTLEIDQKALKLLQKKDENTTKSIELQIANNARANIALNEEFGGNFNNPEYVSTKEKLDKEQTILLTTLSKMKKFASTAANKTVIDSGINDSIQQIYDNAYSVLGLTKEVEGAQQKINFAIAGRQVEGLNGIFEGYKMVNQFKSKIPDNEDNKVLLQSVDINQESQLNAFMGQLRTTLDQPRINIVNYLNSSATYQDLKQAFSNATKQGTRSGVVGKSLQYLGLNPSIESIAKAYRINPINTIYFEDAGQQAGTIGDKKWKYSDFKPFIIIMVGGKPKKLSLSTTSDAVKGFFE
tara:strand:+ start:2420 stop:3667 length:1248 start_codon:yes stop_codon:yes gene_type:complete